MPILKFEAEISEHQVQQIEAMRGDIPRDEFLRKALVMGLCDLQDDINRLTKEFILNAFAGQTKNYQKCRKIAGVAEVSGKRLLIDSGDEDGQL